MRSYHSWNNIIINNNINNDTNNIIEKRKEKEKDKEKVPTDSHKQKRKEFTVENFNNLKEKYEILEKEFSILKNQGNETENFQGDDI